MRIYMHVVRRVLPTEYNKYRIHLKQLDNDDRRLRFTTIVSDSFIDQLCDQIEENKDEHVLFCIENNTLDFVGMGHVVMGSSAEIAISVLKEYQNQKMGSAIMERLLQFCRTQGIQSGYMVCLQTNHAIRTICNKHNVKIESEYGESSGEVTLEEPNIGTHLNEAMSITRGVIDYAQKRFFLPWTLITNFVVQSLPNQTT